MGRRYSAYGMRLEANHALSGMAELFETAEPHIRIWLNERPPWYSSLPEPFKEPFYTSPDLDSWGRHSISVWKLPSVPGFHIIYDDGTEFFLDSKGTEIWTCWPSSQSLEDAAVYLRGPIMGFVLRLRGRIPLHASAVDLEGQAILLTGPAGSGKSTTAACFVQMGFPVLSDDIVELVEVGESFLAQPGYPCLCLWPPSVEALFGAADALPLLTPNWTKRFLPLQKSGGLFRSEPLPVAAIYWLDERRDDSERPEIESLTPQAAFIALVGNTYMNYLLDQGMRVKEFDVLRRVVAKIPVRRLRPRHDLSGLRELCKLVREDLTSTAEASPISSGKECLKHA